MLFISERTWGSGASSIAAGFKSPQSVVAFYVIIRVDSSDSTDRDKNLNNRVVPPH